MNNDLRMLIAALSMPLAGCSHIRVETAAFTLETTTFMAKRQLSQLSFEADGSASLGGSVAKADEEALEAIVTAAVKAALMP